MTNALDSKAFEAKSPRARAREAALAKEIAGKAAAAARKAGK